MNLCPCTSQSPFSSCCEPLLSGASQAKTPEALMRSRYSAHVQRNTRYLVESTLPEQRDELGLDELQAWVQGTRWKALRILSSLTSVTTANEGWVEFQALYEVEGKHYLHHEHSHFELRSGRWYFDLHPEPVSGQSENDSRVLERNDACPCGSGRKLKKCCALN